MPALLTGPRASTTSDPPFGWAVISTVRSLCHAASDPVTCTSVFVLPVLRASVSPTLLSRLTTLVLVSAADRVYASLVANSAL